MINLILASIAGLAIGLGGAYFTFRPNAQKIEDEARKDSEQKRKDAQRDADRMLNQARENSQKLSKQTTQEETNSRERINKLQQQADSRIANREEVLEQRISRTDEKRERYEESVRKNEEKQDELQVKIDDQNVILEKISKLTLEEAKKILFDRMEKEVDSSLAETLNRKVELMTENAENTASEVIVQSIQRLAPTVVNEHTTSIVRIETEEVKGKIIGREGRNINAFEMMTGVDVIIDDTPGAITLACFDMFRRYVAKVALEKLVKDGRINPSRIEECIVEAQTSTDKLILELGQKTAQELWGGEKLPDALLKLIGRLRFRTSYGQNVLTHSIEVAYIAEGIANEIPGADPVLCRKAGLLHDIGKAVSHEVEGGHAVIGKEILEKFGIDNKVIIAMMSHHEDFPYESIEARIIQAADAISAARPGARRDTLEKYIRRLKELESISGSFAGVDKVFAIQAGREVRVFVNSSEVDDNASAKLSFDIARKIEKECQYPGEVKVAIIRENRFEEIAR